MDLVRGFPGFEVKHLVVLDWTWAKSKEGLSTEFLVKVVISSSLAIEGSGEGYRVYFEGYSEVRRQSNLSQLYIYIYNYFFYFFSRFYVLVFLIGMF